jgi:hypothetical protein
MSLQTKPPKTYDKEDIMIRATMAFLLALMLLFSAGTVFGAEYAKEGSGEYRSGKTGTFVFLAMGKERGQMNFEEVGVVVSAPENSPFYNATFKNLGTSHVIKGKWDASGMVEFTCTNGDKIYSTFEAQGVMGGSSSSVGKFVGGTGACTGITGTFEIKGTPGIKAAKKGTYQGISVGKVTWTIP